MTLRLNEIACVDALEYARSLPDKCVHVGITSVPYWGLRSYGTSPLIWDGADKDCEHAWGPIDIRSRRGTAAGATAQAGNTQKRVCPPDLPTGQFCQRCGAWRGELGSEPTPSLFVAHIVALFREFWRVLRDDASFWLNVGDTYAANRTYQVHSTKGGAKHGPAQAASGGMRVPDGLKEKDLCLMPARIALALQEAGWYVRSEIVWAKLSPMPESCTDRPTNATERIYLLTKRPTYYYDAEAVRQANTDGSIGRWGGGGERQTGNKWADQQEDGNKPSTPFKGASLTGRNLWSYWLLGPEPNDADFCTHCGAYFDGALKRRIKVVTAEDGTRKRICPNCCRDDGWLGHYAAFPTEIPRRCIRAGSSERGACPHCGAPWVRVVERSGETARERMYGRGASDYANAYGNNPNGLNYAGQHTSNVRQAKTVGWRQSCSCPPAEPIPCVVFDPFMGSGTTAIVAMQEGRDWLGSELNANYVRLANARIRHETGWTRRHALPLDDLEPVTP